MSGTKFMFKLNGGWVLVSLYEGVSDRPYVLPSVGRSFWYARVDILWNGISGLNLNKVASGTLCSKHGTCQLTNNSGTNSQGDPICCTQTCVLLLCFRALTSRCIKSIIITEGKKNWTWWDIPSYLLCYMVKGSHFIFFMLDIISNSLYLTLSAMVVMVSCILSSGPKGGDAIYNRGICV